MYKQSFKGRVCLCILRAGSIYWRMKRKKPQTSRLWLSIKSIHFFMLRAFLDHAPAQFPEYFS